MEIWFQRRFGIRCENKRTCDVWKSFKNTTFGRRSKREGCSAATGWWKIGNIVWCFGIKCSLREEKPQQYIWCCFWLERLAFANLEHQRVITKTKMDGEKSAKRPSWFENTYLGHWHDLVEQNQRVLFSDMHCLLRRERVWHSWSEKTSSEYKGLWHERWKGWIPTEGNVPNEDTSEQGKWKPYLCRHVGRTPMHTGSQDELQSHTKNAWR